MDHHISVKTEIKEVSAHHICWEKRRAFRPASKIANSLIACVPPQGYSDEVKRECLKMYVNGMGFRGIELVKGVQTLADSKIASLSHDIDYLGKTCGRTTTVRPMIHRQFQKLVNKGVLETFVGSKKTVRWLWTAVNHFTQGILAWVLGDHSAETCATVMGYRRHLAVLFLYHGWMVGLSWLYSVRATPIVSKTYMTRVEGENTRLRHPERSIASQNAMLF